MQTLRRLSASASGLRLFLFLSAVAVIMVGAVTVFADPAWWQNRGVKNAQAADNFAPANLGQAKHLVAQALAEMNDKLNPIGGAGFTQTNLFPSPPAGPGQGGYNAATWQAYAEANYAPLNIGQLKYLSYRFYDRLKAIGYSGPPSGLSSAGYPWTLTTADDNNFAIANLGQLKNVFSFDLTYDGDVPANGLPDWWENYYFGHTGVDPNAVGTSGVSNLLAYLQGRNPTKASLADSSANAVTKLSVFTPLH